MKNVSPLFETRVEGRNFSSFTWTEYRVTHDWRDLIIRNIIKLIKGFYDRPDDLNGGTRKSPVSCLTSTGCYFEQRGWRKHL